MTTTARQAGDGRARAATTTGRLTGAFLSLAVPALAAMLLGAQAPAQAAEDISGVWLTQSGDTRVRISPCGGAMCGVIVWNKSGGKDENNPDASKRARPLNGVAMISGMKPDGDGFSGQLYNYTDGKTYTGKAKRVSAGELQLKGCVMGGLICRSQTWTRVQ